MHRKSLVWKLFPVYFVIALASVAVVGLVASEALREFYYSQAENDLRIRTRLIEAQIARQMSKGDNAALQPLIISLSRDSQARVTVIDRSGRVLADSEANPAKMENHADRREVRAALRGRVGTDRRMSPTLRVTTAYSALPLRQKGEIVGVVRAALRATAIDAPPRVQYARIAVAAILIALLSGVVSYLAARRISGPIAEMKSVAASYAQGDFRSRIPLPDTEELASLAETLNTMAFQLDGQMRTITQQAGEQQAIMTSMKEGVVAIDDQDRLLIVNPAAEELLGIQAEFAKGKTIQEVMRNPDLQRILSGLAEGYGPVTEEITLHTHQPRLVEATGTALMTETGKRLGVLVVLNDVTQTRKLENVRKEFVANVSHELRTPITSIKGFVETLREGAVTDPDRVQEFLRIISSQADRLNAIIEDLLTLSRIEQEAEAQEIPMEKTTVCGVLDAAVASCGSKAVAAGVSVDLQCAPGIQAMMNAPLLEQAIANLIDNAIKYSPGGSVTIVARQEDGEIAIRVSDTGSGIEPEHIPRLFERFYRVDKARSRKVGGTGLGLAIVKHIVQAHRGRVDVQSAPGVGTTFGIFLPT